MYKPTSAVAMPSRFKIPAFVEYPSLDTNIRDAPAFVALSEKEQKRGNVVKKKPAVQRRLSKVQSMKKELTEKELQQFQEEEKTRMINILMVKTGHTQET